MIRTLLLLILLCGCREATYKAPEGVSTLQGTIEGKFLSIDEDDPNKDIYYHEDKFVMHGGSKVIEGDITIRTNDDYLTVNSFGATSSALGVEFEPQTLEAR